jgi:hypothetical protein
MGLWERSDTGSRGRCKGGRVRVGGGRSHEGTFSGGQGYNWTFATHEKPIGAGVTKQTQSGTCNHVIS